jgi:hypothetical protein
VRAAAGNVNGAIAAANYFTQALALDPGSAAARDGFRQVRAAIAPP